MWLCSLLFLMYVREKQLHLRNPATTCEMGRRWDFMVSVNPFAVGLVECLPFTQVPIGLTLVCKGYRGISRKTRRRSLYCTSMKKGGGERRSFSYLWIFFFQKQGCLTLMNGTEICVFLLKGLLPPPPMTSQYFRGSGVHLWGSGCAHVPPSIHKWDNQQQVFQLMEECGWTICTVSHAFTSESPVVEQCW